MAGWIYTHANSGWLIHNDGHSHLAAYCWGSSADRVRDCIVANGALLDADNTGSRGHYLARDLLFGGPLEAPDLQSESLLQRLQLILDSVQYVMIGGGGGVLKLLDQ